MKNEFFDINLSFLDSFCDFIVERQNIWYRKEILKLSKENWTNDRFLKKGYFTNIYREDDKTTKKIIEIIELTSENRENQVFNVLCAHFFNYIPTLNTFFPLDIDKTDFYTLSEECRNISIIGLPVFTTAILPPKKYGELDIFTSIPKIFKDYVENIKEFIDIFSDNTSPSGIINSLYKFHGIGNFRAYEIYLSLAYTDWFPYGEDDYVYLGLGAEPVWSTLFNNRMYPNLENFKLLKKFLIPILESKGFKRKPKKHITIRGIEGAMCEYRKYLRIKEREGKCVRTYETFGSGK